MWIMLVVVIAIATAWSFTARRASRTPRRAPHEQDHLRRT